MTQTEIKTVEGKIEEISKDVTVIKKEFESISIETQEDFIKATEFVSKVKGRLSRIEDLRKFFVAPLKLHIKDIDSKFKPQSKFLESIIDDIKSKISTYHLKKEEEARIEEKRLEKLREKRDERREKSGLEQIATPVATVKRPESSAKTESGTVTTRKVWKFRVVDINKVPRSFLRCSIVHATVQQKIDAGIREIKGLEIYEDIQVNISAR